MTGRDIPLAPGQRPATASPPVAGRSWRAPGGGRLVPVAAMLVLAALIDPASAQAQGGESATGVDAVTVTAPPRIGGPPPKPPCVTADVADHRAADIACAAQRLDQAAKAAQAAATGDPTLTAPSARSRDTTVGVTSATAVSQQFGSSFGKSVTPQRPAPPPPAPSPFARRP